MSKMGSKSQEELFVNSYEEWNDYFDKHVIMTMTIWTNPILIFVTIPKLLLDNHYLIMKEYFDNT